MLFTYNEEDFVFQTSWTETKLTPFDEALQSMWQNALENGYFRYRLNILDSKILPGRYKFLAQLNPDRGSKRRSPETFDSLAQPFNPEKFNFTKIHENEILFDVNDKHSKSKTSDCIAINVSPFEFACSLLIPNRLGCLPQVLTFECLKRAIEVILLSGSPALRGGFNSLRGYASTNHLHFHLFYLQHQMPLESINVEKLSGPCYVLKKFPSKGYVFQLSSDHDILELTSSVYKLTSFLQNSDVAHNVFITRGSSFVGCECVRDSMRIYVWARKYSSETMSSHGFDPSICELFGHLVVKVESAYSSLTEDEVAEVLKSVCEEPFARVYDAVKALFDEEKKQ